MGEERKHARFSLVGGGARARGVAFRTSQRALSAAGARAPARGGGAGAQPLERRRRGARGAALAEHRGGRAACASWRRRDFWDELDAELDGDPRALVARRPRRRGEP